MDSCSQVERDLLNKCEIADGPLNNALRAGYSKSVCRKRTIQGLGILRIDWWYSANQCFHAAIFGLPLVTGAYVESHVDAVGFFFDRCCSAAHSLHVQEYDSCVATKLLSTSQTLDGTMLSLAI